MPKLVFISSTTAPTGRTFGDIAFDGEDLKFIELQFAETENVVTNSRLRKTALVDAFCRIQTFVQESDRLLSREEGQLLFDVVLDLRSELQEILADEHGALEAQYETVVSGRSR